MKNATSFEQFSKDVQKEIVEYLQQNDFLSAKRLYDEAQTQLQEMPDSAG